MRGGKMKPYPPLDDELLLEAINAQSTITLTVR